MMKKIILPLLLAASLAGSAQTASNKLTFQSGQKIEMTTSMNITSSSMIGETSGNVTNIEEYTVANASASATTLQKAMKKIKLNFNMMGQDFVVDSDNKEDMEGQFGGPIKQIMEQKYEFTVDANGKITSIQSGGKKKNDDASGMMGMMMPGMSSLAAAPKVGNPSIFKILPEGREVKKGDTWTDSVSTQDAQSTTVFTVKDITDTDVLLDFQEKGKMKATQSAMGMNVDVMSNTETTGTIVLDKATGLLKQRTATTTTASNMNMGGQEMSATTKATAETMVKVM